MGTITSQRSGRALAYGLTAALVAVSFAMNAASAADDDVSQRWRRLWHPAFQPSLGGRIELHDVRRLGDRFAITGGDEHGAVVWWSEDGVEWTRSPRSEATQHGYGSLIDGEPGAYVMIGGQWTPGLGVRIWYSADGLRWEPARGELGGDVSSLVRLGDGTHLVYGDEGRVGECWMASSVDAGATWEPRWEGDWDSGAQGHCIHVAVIDRDGLVGAVAGGIAVSDDGLTWEPVVTQREIRKSFDARWRDVHAGNLAPLDEDTFIVAGHDTATLTWSRGGGLELVEGLIDWTDRSDALTARGEDRGVALRPTSPVPLVSPPAGAYEERFTRAQPVCRPNKPRVADIVSMGPRERLDCYGGRKLIFDAWIPHSEYGGVCPFGKPYTWLMCEDYWLASGPGPSPGYLNYGLAPKARLADGLGPGSWGAHVRVAGHFDDPAASRCPEPGWDGAVPDGWERRTKAQFVNECQRRFVVTRMRLIEEVVPGS